MGQQNGTAVFGAEGVGDDIDAFEGERDTLGSGHARARSAATQVYLMFDRL
jgi:hypothetical protein